MLWDVPNNHIKKESRHIYFLEIMRKVLILSLLFSFVLGFTACNDDDDVPNGGARVKVTAKDYDGDKQEGVTVYMYIDEPITIYTSKDDADRSEVTNKHGEATFTLDSRELDLLDTETELYFAVFYRSGGEDMVEGTTAVRVERDDDKSIELKVPF